MSFPAKPIQACKSQGSAADTGELHISLSEVVFDAGKQSVIQEVLEGMLIKYEARRWTKAV